MIGQHFLNNCLTSEIISSPWSHQIINDTLPKEEFDQLRKECESLDVPKSHAPLATAISGSYFGRRTRVNTSVSAVNSSGVHQ